MLTQHSTPVSQPATDPFLHATSGFLRHPDHAPLKLRPLPPWRQWQYHHHANHGPGLLCPGQRYLTAGTWVEITIPLREHEEHFCGQIVMVRATDSGYDLGLLLATNEDTARLRIIEQFCHMERYCRCLDNACPEDHHELHARDWVAKFAASFPSLS